MLAGVKEIVISLFICYSHFSHEVRIYDYLLNLNSENLFSQIGARSAKNGSMHCGLLSLDHPMFFKKKLYQNGKQIHSINSRNRTNLQHWKTQDSMEINQEEQHITFSHSFLRSKIMSMFIVNSFFIGLSSD